LQKINLLDDEDSLTKARSALKDAHRLVIKVGSSLVTNEGRGLDEQAIGEWCRQMAILIKGDDQTPPRELIMVSSGAIAEGMKRLGWTSLAQSHS
jgi:glutamate 5-kinase